MQSNARKDVWETYTKAWCTKDAAQRLRLFEQCLDTGCVYTDPLARTQGYDQLSTYITELHANVPGVAFMITDFKTHHDRSLTHWNMVDATGNILSQGASYGVYGTDGRLREMTGFFEPPAG